MEIGYNDIIRSINIIASFCEENRHGTLCEASCPFILKNVMPHTFQNCIPCMFQNGIPSHWQTPQEIIEKGISDEGVIC